MAEVFILEFPSGSREEYDNVNARMGIDPSAGQADAPDGLISHTAALTEAGGVLVFEVWDSKDSQARFMESKLGPALRDAGAAEPSRAEWLTLMEHFNT